MLCDNRISVSLITEQGMQMTDETELKLELTTKGASVIEASSLLSGKPSMIEQHSIYFDTPNWLLSKAGLSLRIRQSNGVRVQTVKGDGANAAGLFVRSEWERSVDDDRPILDDTNPIRALLGEKIRKIGPIFEVQITRKLWNIHEDDNIIEVALDRGEAIAGERKTPICEIELELKAGEPSALFSMARKLDAIAPVRLGVLSKAERGYLLRGAMVECVKAECITLEKDMSVARAFQRIAGANLRQFRLNEALIDSRKPDALHQARVGLRRLRSSLWIFKQILADEEVPRIREELRWLAGELGKARNLDVVTARVRDQLLHDQLETARIKAYASLAETLESARARALVMDIVQWIESGRWLLHVEIRDEARQTLNLFASEVLRRLRKKIKKAGNLEILDDAQRHRVRKNAKKLRYASEFFASLFGGKDGQRRHKRFVNALDHLQTELGALNDLAMAPSVIVEIGLGDSVTAQLQLSADQKAELLIAANEAREEMLDAKRFWA